MRMQIYVPTAKVERYSPGDKYTWHGFQKAIIDVAGGITVQTAFGSWANESGAIVSEPVFIVEALMVSQEDVEKDDDYLPHGLVYSSYSAFSRLQDVVRDYVHQLLRGGEEAVLVVIDNVPVMFTEKDFK